VGLFKRHQTTDVIDLTEVPPPEAAPKPPQFGQPTQCPACSHRGFLDHIDVVDRLQYEHCPECRTTWETREADILAGA
jgi:hypothetical protein